MDHPDIQELLAARQQHLDILGANPDSLEDMLELICADCLLCIQYTRSQDASWGNYALCNEIMEYVPRIYHALMPLSPDQRQQQVELLIDVCQRAAEMLYDHPRLKHRMLKYALDLRISDGLEPDFDLEKEVTYLCKNIIWADCGSFEKIKPQGHLKHDPVEWTQAYEQVIHLAQQQAMAELADMPRGMGFCHAYWPTLSRILASHGITWHSPAQLNPGVIFD